jgi:hypothetical protein
MEANLTKTDGKVSMDKSFDFMCSLLRNGKYTVKIERKKESRSIPQNSLMWMWFKCMEEATGQPKEDFHAYYKRKFLMRQVNIKGHWVDVVGETKTLSSSQFSEFLEKIKADAAIDFGIMLPLPEDRMYRDFVDEYKNR